MFIVQQITYEIVEHMSVDCDLRMEYLNDIALECDVPFLNIQCCSIDLYLQTIFGA
jgi:hypothetical protein